MVTVGFLELNSIARGVAAADAMVKAAEVRLLLSRPVCLCAEDPELLEKALRIYVGLALYDGTWEQDPAVVKYFCEKYGMIWL